MTGEYKESTVGVLKETDKVIPSAELFGGAKFVLIRHGDALYRLVRTRQNKLILNK